MTGSFVRGADGNGGWSYHYRSKRGADIDFSGRVLYISGEAGERLLGEFGAVLRDLLEWAFDQQQSERQDGEQHDDAE